MAKKITVITPTSRPEGLEIVKTALELQTFKYFEWLIISPKPISQKLKITSNMLVRILSDPPRHKGDVWSLNKAYNEAIRQSQGELIVSWQDFTFANEDALEKFWFHYSINPKALVTGVGHKYTQVTPSLGKLVWKDPRMQNHIRGIVKCFPKFIEANFCSIPKKALYEIGGFDESLDRFFGMDAFSVFDRLGIVGGWDFYLDQTNRSYSLFHERIKDWDGKNAINGPYQQRRQSYLQNPVLEYLK